MSVDVNPGSLRRGQRGASLVVVMIVLLVVTVIGIAGARLALLGEMAARHDRDSQIAFEAAEAALSDAQDDIEGNSAAGGCSALRGEGTFDVSLSTLPDGACNTTTAKRGLCGGPIIGALRPTWASVDFLDNGATAPTVQVGTYTCRPFDAGSSGVKPARSPRYMVEVLKDSTWGQQASSSGGKPANTPVFRITAMGFGPRIDTRVVLQVEYRKSKTP